jgi:CRISPR/Cas system-associated exonuclease Cas4 (RecB family)
VSTKLMSQRDRTELRRILRARFELLHQQLMQRQHEVNNRLEEQIRKESEAAIKEAQRKAEVIHKKAQKLEAEAKQLALDMKAKGVQPGNGQYAGDTYSTFLTFSFTERWSPINLHKKVQQAYKKVTEQAGVHKVDLRLQQLQLEEELAISALASDEAKDFLSKVPDIDKLLPMNGNVTAALKEGEVIDG